MGKVIAAIVVADGVLVQVLVHKDKLKNNFILQYFKNAAI